MEMSSLSLLDRLSLRIAEVVSVEEIIKAKLPTLHITYSLGKENIIKHSCAKFVRNYPNLVSDLIGKKLLVLANVPIRRVAGIKSEVLTLGFPDNFDDGQAIGITPLNAELIEPGSSIIKSTDILPYAEDGSVLFFDMVFKSGTVTSVMNGSQIIVNVGEEGSVMAILPKGLSHSLNELIGAQIPILIDSEDNGKGFALIVQGKESRSILKIDKPVKNGLKLF